MALKQITAKFKSKCKETGKAIMKGELMYYNYATRECFSMASKKAMQARTENENESMAEMIQENEDVYFDNFCYANNI